MNCPECNKEVEELVYPTELVDNQCFACGSVLTQEEIDALEAPEDIINSQ